MERVEGTWSIALAGARACAAVPVTSEGRAMTDEAPVQPSSLVDLDDRGLVCACLAGTREAFDVIVERHRRSVYQLCYRFVGNHEDASDLAQDVFLRAYRGLKNFKGDASLGTWLYRIGVNACLNRLSTRPPPAQPLDAADPIVDRGPDPARQLLESEQAKRVRAAIARLPKRQRATLVLRVYHDLPHHEIAQILGSSVGAVKANFFHALRNLKKILERNEADQAKRP
jgi:RNA polymerase sigma-70 factor (ECF subfamily)